MARHVEYGDVKQRLYDLVAKIVWWIGHLGARGDTESIDPKLPWAEEGEKICGKTPEYPNAFPPPRCALSEGHELTFPRFHAAEDGTTWIR